MSSFKVGDVIQDGAGMMGVVVDDPAMVAEYPGMVPVRWSSDWVTVTNPATLQHLDL